MDAPCFSMIDPDGRMAKSEEQRTENREQRTENREQRTENEKRKCEESDDVFTLLLTLISVGVTR